MITNVSVNSFKPSFGLARIADGVAEGFGYPRNSFLDADLFVKQKGRAKNTPMGGTISAGWTLEEIATTYGCTNNPSSNAKFIENCILSKKGKKIISKTGVSDEDKKNTLLMLWDKNYDNPELSTKNTLALLDLIKEYIEPHVYIQNKAMLLNA